MPEGEGEQIEEEAAEASGPSVEERLAAIEATTQAQARAALLGRVVPADALASPVGQLFASAYQGDLTDTAVKAEAVKLGLLPDDSAAGESGTASDEEKAAHDQALGLRTGGAPVSGELGPPPTEIAREAGLAARKSGTEADALSAYFNSRILSAVQGDARGVVDVRAMAR